MERIVLHYNKQHNADPSIPPWVVKYRGETFYVDHLESTIGFSTKETPDNPSTKGSIQFRGQLDIVIENGKTLAKVS